MTKKKSKPKPFNFDFRPESYFSDSDSHRPTLHTDSSKLRWQGAGENYLPEYEDGEVEIACISLESVTGDQISIRAKPADNKIVYRIRDEYGNDFSIKPSNSALPLSLREIIGLIDSADMDGDGATGLTSYFRDMNFEAEQDEDEGADPEDYVSFVTVTSEFYDQIGDWYEQEAQEWLKQKMEQDD